MEEQWKDIIVEKNGIIYDYTGLYQVSNLGRVRSLDRVDSLGREAKGKIMQYKPGKNGYVNVRLSKDGEAKNFYIHRLVATAFIPNPENLPVVNHRDECKTNNCVDNLEWVTVQYNTQHSAHKWSGDKNPMSRKVICLETKQIFECAKDAEKWCGSSKVGACCRGERKTCGGYHWMYLDDYKRQLRMQSDINNSRLTA